MSETWDYSGYEPAGPSRGSPATPGGKDTGADALSLAHRALTRYVAFPCPEAADAVTLWVAATYAQGQLEFASRLVIKSPVKRCGKSRLVDVLGAMVHAPLLTSDISAAALVRSVNPDNPPTLMLDEADAIFGKALKGDEKAEHLRGILNAGFGRDRPYRRWDITTRATEECPTFAMAALAGIGDLPDTIEDRAVIIGMRRKTAAEPVAKYRIRRDKPKVKAAAAPLAEWAAGIAADAGKAEPDMPGGLDDRAEDVWEALVAIADLAGGDWPGRARTAAQVLCGERGSADRTASERLLADLREVFGNREAMHGEDIREALCELPESPWADWYGRWVTARDIAKLLKPYGVKSTDVKLGGVTKKGYRRADLHEPWSRYLAPATGGTATSATRATAQVSALPGVAGSGTQTLPATCDPPVTCKVAEVADVAEPPAATGQARRDTRDGPVCAVCGTPMDPALAGAGFTVHPCCDADAFDNTEGDGK